MKNVTSFKWSFIICCFVCICNSAEVVGQVTLKKDQIFGMYSGVALLMDVYQPENPNGYGIIHISGSGWHAPLSYGAGQLKDGVHPKIFAKPLAEAGYTVFSINHRAAPRFKYPAAVEDAQRAVRFVRFHAQKYGIDPENIGAVGGSSGGHLALSLGVLDGSGEPDAVDSVDRVSGKVQCVVVRAAPADLYEMAQTGTSATLASFIGMRLPSDADPQSAEASIYKEASPVNHVSTDDPPVLLLHGDKDKAVPFDQGKLMQERLREKGVASELLTIPGAGHGPSFPGAKNPPDYIGKMIEWFDDHLKK